jgi:hypothetical protein
MFSGSFILGVVNPLNLAHLNNLIMSHSFCRVQNFNRSLTVSRALPWVVVPLELVNISRVATREIHHARQITEAAIPIDKQLILCDQLF